MLLSVTKKEDLKSYKYMSFEEEADFNRRVLNLLGNKDLMEIQIYEERGFTQTIGHGERVYIIEVYQKNGPELDDLGYAEAVAVMGEEEVDKFQKQVENDNKVDIIWVDEI